MAVIPSLVDHGFTSVERPADEAESFLQLLTPSLVVAFVDPSRQEDSNLLRMIAGFGPYLLVLAPSSAHYQEAFEAGADACLCDGDPIKTVSAQIGAIYRRLDIQNPSRQTSLDLEIGGMRLDRDSKRLRRGERSLQLTPMEFSVLEHLLDNSGRVVSSLELVLNVMGRANSDAEAGQTIKVYIRRLRQKFEMLGAEPELITNLRGHGYLIERRS